MKNLNLPSLLVMLSIAIFFTACTKETSPLESVQAPDLNAIASQISISPEYKVVKEVRVAIFDEFADFYTENKEEIKTDQSILDNFLSSRTDNNNALRDATEQLKAKFSILNSLTEAEVKSIFEIVDSKETTGLELSQSCWDFCHNQYLGCDSICYAEYLYFPEVTYHDYLNCNGACVMFVFNTCIARC